VYCLATCVLQLPLVLNTTPLALMAAATQPTLQHNTPASLDAQPDEGHSSSWPRQYAQLTRSTICWKLKLRTRGGGGGGGGTHEEKKVQIRAQGKFTAAGGRGA